MDETEIPERRSFLKGSLTLGVTMVSGAAGSAAISAPTDKAAPAQAKLPTAQAARSESGVVEVQPHEAEAENAVISKPGSDYMVDCLRAAKIDYVAAMAGSTFRGLHESIVNYGGNKAPELIVCVHEEISAGMAHGYAKVAGKPMACMVHSTVGLQHASMAIYNAWCDRAPMMIIAANGLDATKRRPGVEWTHTASDLAGFVRDFIKWDDTPFSLPHYGESFMRAMSLSMTPPYEPVLIIADSELQEEDAAHEKLTVPRLAQVSPPAGDPAAIDRVASMLIAAQSPVIVVDRLARSPEGVGLLVKLAELVNAPVVDFAGRMNMPNTHYLNHTGRQAALITSADLIVGLELTDIWGVVNAVPDKVGRKSVRIAREDAKVIGVSANYAMIHANVQDAQRYYACDVTVAADAQTCLPQIISAVSAKLRPADRKRIADRRPALEQAYRDTREANIAAATIGWDATPISTARLSMELWERIKDLDWGLVSNWAFISAWPQRLWTIDKFHQYIGGEGGYGIGYNAPASIGAAIAHRDAGRIPVSIQCDGDLMMLPGSLWTLAHHNIPLLMVMHNNRAWHQETMHLKRMSSRRDRGPESWPIGTVMTNPDIDFSMMARSMGVWAEGPIDDPQKLGAAMDRALAMVKSGKPALLDIITQVR